MRNVWWRGCALAVGIVSLLIPVEQSWGLAQLKAGAKTSARVTATDPVLRQMQITFDPGVTNNAFSLSPAAVAVPTYDVTGFQLDVTYDPSLVYPVSGPTGVYPFYANPGINEPPGLIDNIVGSVYPMMAVPGDVDIFTITFQLQPAVSLDTPISVTIGANDPTDYVQAVNDLDKMNPQNGLTVYGPENIEPATATGSVALGDLSTSVPLPPGASLGLACLLAAIAWYAKARRAMKNA